LAYQFLDLLSQTDQFDRAQRLARVLVQRKTMDGSLAPRLLDLSSRQLAAGNVAYAHELWDATSPSPDPLIDPPDGQAFRLKIIKNQGIQEDWKAGQLQYSFDGTQPDVAPLFEKPVAAPTRFFRARLTYEYLSSVAGTRFAWGEWNSPELASSSQWTTAMWQIQIKERLGLRDKLQNLPLRLIYRRNPGATPAQGEVLIRKLQIAIP
jgi:hypothetical protein